MSAKPSRRSAKATAAKEAGAAAEPPTSPPATVPTVVPTPAGVPAADSAPITTPAAAAVDVPAAAAVAPADTPAGAPADAPAAELPVPAVVKPTRRQLVQAVLNTITPPARVRKQVDLHGLNAIVNAKLEPIRRSLDTYHQAVKTLEDGTVTLTREVAPVGDARKKTEKFTRVLTDAERAEYQATVDNLRGSLDLLTQQKTALSKRKIRMSAEVSFTLSMIIDDFVGELLQFAAERTVASDKKIIQTSHLHEDGVELLSYYPLYSRLPTFHRTASAISKQQAEEKTTALLRRELTTHERKWKKEHDIHTPRKKHDAAGAPAPEPVAVAPVVAPAVVAAAAAAVAAPAPDDSDDKTTFEYYVQQLCRPIKDQERFKGVRVSSDIKKYLSDLQVEFLRVAVNQLHLVSTHKDVKTVGFESVLHVVELLLTYHQSPTENITLETVQVPESTALKAFAEAKALAKSENRPFTGKAEDLPLVPGLHASRTMEFPNARFNLLKTRVHKAVADYHEIVLAHGHDETDDSETTETPMDVVAVDAAAQ